MKLQIPFVQLPMQFDAASLAREVSALGDEHWREHPQKLAELPSECCHVACYDALVGQPDEEIGRLCHALDLGWDRALDGTLALSRFTLSAPAADKWQRHAELLAGVLASIQPTTERAARFAASAG